MALFRVLKNFEPKLSSRHSKKKLNICFIEKAFCIKKLTSKSWTFKFILRNIIPTMIKPKSLINFGKKRRKEKKKNLINVSSKWKQNNWITWRETANDDSFFFFFFNDHVLLWEGLLQKLVLWNLPHVCFPRTIFPLRLASEKKNCKYSRTLIK